MNCPNCKKECYHDKKYVASGYWCDLCKISFSQYNKWIAYHYLVDDRDYFLELYFGDLHDHRLTRLFVRKLDANRFIVCELLWQAEYLVPNITPTNAINKIKTILTFQ